MKTIPLIFLLFIFLIPQERPIGNKFDKTSTKEILEGEWEREAFGYEKNKCKESDRFIMSFVMDDSSFNADGYLEYFTYSSKDREARICYLEHGSYSFVFFDILLSDSITKLDITGYLWSEEWSLNVIDSNTISLDNKKYTRSNLVKSNEWYHQEN